MFILNIIQQAGIKEAPKVIWKDRFIGTWEALNMESLHSMKCLNGKDKTITFINQCDSGGTVPKKQ